MSFLAKLAAILIEKLAVYFKDWILKQATLKRLKKQNKEKVKEIMNEKDAAIRAKRMRDLLSS